ncbi:MAG: hypothetical protein CFE46_12450 [Burkholderiales bacterium PBB6]|nr:MAG: hypothetical protein CFE46_12450 [Burkholderiales bacterium PBB6]
MSTLPASTPDARPNNATVIAEMRDWLEKAVIGLNLCPFAKAVYVKEQVRYVVSEATTTDELLEQLRQELEHLAEVSPEKTDTTLLMHPQVLADFLDFNDFLEHADALLEALELDGILQIAEFHPEFQFEGTRPDDISNFTNRAPWPTLHLLREESIDRAVEAFPEAEAIYERNIETLDQLGESGWRALFAGAARVPGIKG